MTIPDEVDIIVAGGESNEANGTHEHGLTTSTGGSAGCVVAGRLAALDRNLKVLLIEGGENNLNNPWVPM